MAYAERTRVNVDQTKIEIEKTLKRYGAKRFAFLDEEGRAVIMFEAHERRVRFDLSLVEGDRERDVVERRRRWRALLLCIKAKLESVLSNIETFEEAFLAHVVMPDGKTVAQHALEPIAVAYQGGKMQPLLPGPG